LGNCNVTPWFSCINRHAIDHVLDVPPEVKETPNAAQFAKTKLKEMGAVSKDEIIMLGVFGIYCCYGQVFLP
jgi:di/tricarboxylate transporter